MKPEHRYRFWPVAALALFIPTQLQAGEKPRPISLSPGSRIAVVAMDSRGGAQVDGVVADMLTTVLRRNGWRVLERLELNHIVREHDLVRGGVIDPETASEAGKVLGAQYILGARATEFGVRESRQGGIFGLGPFAGLQLRTTTGRVVLDARIIDVRTGEVLTTATGEGKIVNHGGTLVGGSWVGGSISLGGVDINSKEWSESLLGRAARKAVDVVLGRLLDVQTVPGARVLAVAENGDVVLGLGQNDGVRPGDRIDLLSIDAIRDAAGAPVWTEESVIGLLEVTEVRADRSKARVVDGRSPTEGDTVRRQTKSGSSKTRTNG